jgi:methionyl-tRNA formyltransferase
MRVIFAGTPEFAARSLQDLIASGHELVMVLTQPDRPAGRGMKPRLSAVKQIAVDRGLPIRQPTTLRDENEQRILRELNADVIVVAAFGLMLPQAVLDAPRLGAINIHASLLPRWRGAAPIQRAMLAGDVRTGVSIMRMDAGLDTGPVFMREEIPIDDLDTAQTVHDRLAEIGSKLLQKVLYAVEQGLVTPVAQLESGALYATKISKEEARIDWSQDALQIRRQIRAFNPSPGAMSRLGQTEIKIWQARLATNSAGKCGEILQADASGLLVACGTQALCLEILQKSGGRRLAAKDFLQGFQVVPGMTLEL